MKLGNLLLALSLLALASLAGYAKAVKKSNAAREDVLAQDFKQFVAKMRYGQNLERFLYSNPYRVQINGDEHTSVTCQELFANQPDCTFAEFYKNESLVSSIIRDVRVKNKMTVRWVRLESPDPERVHDVLLGFADAVGGYRFELLIWKEFID